MTKTTIWPLLLPLLLLLRLLLLVLPLWQNSVEGISCVVHIFTHQITAGDQNYDLALAATSVASTAATAIGAATAAPAAFTVTAATYANTA